MGGLRDDEHSLLRTWMPVAFKEDLETSLLRLSYAVLRISDQNIRFRVLVTNGCHTPGTPIKNLWGAYIPGESSNINTGLRIVDVVEPASGMPLIFC